MSQPLQIKPPRLNPGDAVGIVSPSWGGAGAYPHRLAKGVQHIESLGYRVKIGAHALEQQGFVSATAVQRAQDIHDFFLDDEVKLIVAAIGGDHACHLLPLLDFELMKAHPTPLMGFSDITVLNLAIWTQTGLTMFNGPALLTDFAEYPHMLSYTEKHFQRALTQARAMGQIEPSTYWTEEFLDWGTREDQIRPRVLQESPGWTCLRKGSAQGRLIGGCLESLQHLRGTRFWPDWSNSILFIETSEEAPTPAKVDGILMDYENMGVFSQIQGLLMGRPMKYSSAERLALHHVLMERTQGYDFPIIADMDFGHTAPQMTLPMGCWARLDGDARRFEILESAVS